MDSSSFLSWWKTLSNSTPTTSNNNKLTKEQQEDNLKVIVPSFSQSSGSTINDDEEEDTTNCYYKKKVNKSIIILIHEYYNSKNEVNDGGDNKNLKKDATIIQQLTETDQEWVHCILPVTPSFPSMNWKFIVINAPFLVERKRSVKNQFEKYDVSITTDSIESLDKESGDTTPIIKWEIMEGVDKHDLIMQPITDDLSTIFDTRTKDMIPYEHYLKHHIIPGHLACTWSHIKCWKRLLKDKEYQAYFILEDDFTFLLPVEEIIKRINSLPNGTEMAHTCYSDWYPFEVEEKVDTYWYIPKKKFFNRLTGYWITKNGVIKALEFCKERLGWHADDILSQQFTTSHDPIKLYVSYDHFVAGGNPSDSSTDDQLP
jgi:GR25 family glycosyltransferase involved in LPS biosynthesis